MAPLEVSAAYGEVFKTGLTTRREVVGDAYVNGALEKGSTQFARPMQEFVTSWCWGDVWNRPGLERKQRSLLNIGMLIALKSWPELGVHTRGAINNGVTEVEIREAILQAAIYCGVPAGIEATKVASATIDDMVAKGEHTRELAEVTQLTPMLTGYLHGLFVFAKPIDVPVRHCSTFLGPLSEHIQGENDQDLVRPEAVLKGECEQLAKSFDNTRMFLSSRSHPCAGEHPVFETVMSSLVAPMDKLSDLFRKFPRSTGDASIK